MKAFVVERYGPPDVLELCDVETPAPESGEVLVRVHAASINDWDLAIVTGKPLLTRLIHGLFTPRVRIGCDIAGRVEAVGDGVDAFRPGDEVHGDLCQSGFGAFAEYACVPETALAPKPPGMTFEQAAAIPQAGMLAVQGLLDVGQLQRGQKVLLNGAGGGVGTIALQIARLYDAEVTVVDKRNKLEMLRGLGAEHALDYREEDFTRSGRRWELILDVKTNRSPFAYTRALDIDGKYVTVGGDISNLLQITVIGPVISRLRHKHLHLVSLKPNKDLGYLSELFESGKLVPVMEKPFRFADLREAVRLFASGDHKGKVVVTID